MVEIKKKSCDRLIKKIESYKNNIDHILSQIEWEEMSDERKTLLCESYFSFARFLELIRKEIVGQEGNKTIYVISSKEKFDNIKLYVGAADSLKKELKEEHGIILEVQ